MDDAAAASAHPKPRQVIHIGQRKTGTTWLQTVLQAAADSSRAFELVHGQARTWTTANSSAADDKIAWSELTQLLSQWRERPIFISLESLIAFDHELMAKALAEAVPGAAILVTTRAPEGYLRSSFGHAILRGRHLSSEAFARKFARGGMTRTHDLVSVKRAYSAAFGPGAVHFLPFEYLRSDQSGFLNAVSALIGIDLAPHVASVLEGRKVTPPDAFLALAQRANEKISTFDKEWLRSEEWQTLLRMSADAMAEAKDLWPIVEDRTRRLGLSLQMPDFPDDLLAEFQAMQAPLRDLAVYQPYLESYGFVTRVREAVKQWCTDE